MSAISRFFRNVTAILAGAFLGIYATGLIITVAFIVSIPLWVLLGIVLLIAGEI